MCTEIREFALSLNNNERQLDNQRLTWPILLHSNWKVAFKFRKIVGIWIGANKFIDNLVDLLHFQFDTFDTFQDDVFGFLSSMEPTSKTCLSHPMLILFLLAAFLLFGPLAALIILMVQKSKWVSLFCSSGCGCWKQVSTAVRSVDTTISSRASFRVVRATMISEVCFSCERVTALVCEYMNKDCACFMRQLPF